jgi:hypothetical protein
MDIGNPLFQEPYGTRQIHTKDILSVIANFSLPGRSCSRGEALCQHMQVDHMTAEVSAITVM